ncbi:MAG: anhydro-N-acetylmuramic acid kinase [Bdellovibrionales bacterium]|nr:anhydro-N-acetylmuramic acid kinase [Bdellovibrionales bacterium]
MPTWLDNLSKVAAKSRRVILGAMSGTSANSIDVAVCAISDFGPPHQGIPGARVELKHFYSHPFPPDLQNSIFDVLSLNVREISELHAALGDLFADACEAALVEAKMGIDKVDLIGSHGQTVYHHSGNPGATKTSLQLADADRIAERLGCAVFSDFRARDLACGGEGAPLTPYSDLILFGGRSDTAIINLGGIANITVLNSDPEKVFGFDCGPANAPLDRLARILSGGEQNFDPSGERAWLGKADHRFVERLLADDPYLKRKPPKSTGFEMYGDEFVGKLIDKYGAADNNLMASVAEFVARTIFQAVEKYVLPVRKIDQIVLAGGGCKNTFLVSRIKDLLAPLAVRMSEDFGVPNDAREAMAFAVLANDALGGLPTALRSVTGARRTDTLGKLSLPRLS